MRTKNSLKKIATIGFSIGIIGVSFGVFGQQLPQNKQDYNFWKDVQFGGGLGLGFGNGYTNISVAPSAVYNFNDYISAGIGLQYSYLKEKNIFASSQYGGSIIGLVNPIEEVQLSVELEQLKVNLNFDDGSSSDNFWNTGLFLGAGYRTNNVIFGARYNLLFNEDKGVYGDALLPFVRVFF